MTLIACINHRLAPVSWDNSNTMEDGSTNIEGITLRCLGCFYEEKRDRMNAIWYMGDMEVKDSDFIYEGMLFRSMPQVHSKST